MKKKRGRFHVHAREKMFGESAESRKKELMGGNAYEAGQRTWAIDYSLHHLFIYEYRNVSTTLHTC